MKYIDAEKLRSVLQNTINSMKEKDAKGERYDAFLNGKLSICEELLGCIDSLQQEPRFPQYDNIVEKVFGAGNLEFWERDEAEMLVALAKEELLKSLQQKQPETPSGEEVMNMCNQILIDWVKEGKTPEEREQREQAHIRFFELYDEYMEQSEVALEKGETINTEILLGENGKPYIHSFEVYDYNKNIPLFLPGTEVTLQIRKVEQNG